MVEHGSIQQKQSEIKDTLNNPKTPMYRNRL